MASNLHALIPEAMPEIIPAAIPGGDWLVLVLRVAAAVSHPVMVSGKVLFRIPRHSVPADRRRVLDLAARNQAASGAEHVRMNVERRPWQPADIALWPRMTPGRKPSSGQAFCGSPAGWNCPGEYLTGHGWDWLHAKQP